MRNLTATICLTIAFLNPSKLLAESYICSHELSRFDRAGEVETLVFSRTGNYFQNEKKTKFKILSETSSHLFLYWGSGDAVSITLVNKVTKEFGETYISMDDFRKHPPGPNTFGKCKVME